MTQPSSDELKKKISDAEKRLGQTIDRLDSFHRDQQILDTTDGSKLVSRAFTDLSSLVINAILKQNTLEAVRFHAETDKWPTVIGPNGRGLALCLKNSDPTSALKSQFAAFTFKRPDPAKIETEDEKPILWMVPRILRGGTVAWVPTDDYEAYNTVGDVCLKLISLYADSLDEDIRMSARR